MTSRHFHWINSLLYTALLSRIIFLGQHGTNGSALINRIERILCSTCGQISFFTASSTSCSSCFIKVLSFPTTKGAPLAKASAKRSVTVSSSKPMRNIPLIHRITSPGLKSFCPGFGLTWPLIATGGGKWGGPFCTNIGSDCNFSSGCPQCQCCCKLTKMWPVKSSWPPTKEWPKQGFLPQQNMALDGGKLIPKRTSQILKTAWKEI